METILFLHGWGGNEQSFAPIEKYFRVYYNCVFIALPCFQMTDPNSPETPWTLDDYVNFVVKALDDKNISKCHIVAHSFGARVAVLLATRQPERFEKLVLTGPAGIKKRFSLRLKIKIWFYKLRKKLFGNKVKGGSVDYKSLTDTGKATFQNIINRDLRNEITQINNPTLIIWGENDRAVPRYMVKLWTKLNSNTKLIAYENAGHFCFIDNPQRFIIDTKEFINVYL